LPRAGEQDNPRIAKGFFNLLFYKSRIHVRNAPSVFDRLKDADRLTENKKTTN
jgi:hypothetical protein